MKTRRVKVAKDKTGKPKYPGTPITTNGNQLVAYYTEAKIAEAGIFYPITPSTEMGENFELSFAKGELNVFGDAKIAIEAEGEHAAQGGAIAAAVAGKRVVNFTSGQGLVYGLEQYYHAPGKLATMVVEVAARALTKHALNVHCGHDDLYAALDTGWTILFAKDAQQAADQALILRKANELALNPGINVQDGFLTSHLERTSLQLESDLIREFLGRPDDIIESPTEAQRILFGPMRRRVPKMIDLENPILLGPVQNQEHYMNGVAARRNNFVEPIHDFLRLAYDEFGQLTGRHYGFLSTHNPEADTLFVALGSAAENIEAAADHVHNTRGETFGVIHLNVIRPFPEKEIIKALAGKKNVIVLERMDDQTAGNGPIARDIRTALAKAVENHYGNAHHDLPALAPEDVPRLYNGIYGLGSRDFRPEAILGAYEYVTGKIGRNDGRKAEDGESFFYLGINHPYNVGSQERPSLLPEHAIGVRFHSIGGWGMITTGKNMGEILGALGEVVSQRSKGNGSSKVAPELHISANPKYGSEKKGSPTEYFLTMAPERIRVNCDLKHVDVVLSADSKIFTHGNPLDGIKTSGAFVWESQETDPALAWQRIPVWARKEIVDKKVRIFLLPGFEIAKNATDREDLQMRMQGNSFLGAFFKVSTFLEDNSINEAEFHEIVEAQYQKKFGRFGKSVVASNMQVMKDGFDRVWELEYGDLDAADTSSMRGPMVSPLGSAIDYGCVTDKAPLHTAAIFDGEFRASLGYHQPSSPLAAVGMMASATGATASKYVARRQVPVFIAENCTQCMACITSCPDTALPNTAQDISTVLNAAIASYVEDTEARKVLLGDLSQIESLARSRMNELIETKTLDVTFATVVLDILQEMERNNSALNHGSLDLLREMLPKMPFSYAKTNAIYKMKEKQEAGSGGLFGIFVSDLCKGCGECATECGDHDALIMREETETINGEHLSAIELLDRLPDTPAQYLGKYDYENPEETIAAALQNHLMVRSYYDALVSGDGACAGCGEKSVLRAIATITEALMRPRFHTKAARIEAKAKDLEENGAALLAALKKSSPESYGILRRSTAHLIMQMGREEPEEVEAMMAEANVTDAQIAEALVTVLRQDAYNHRDIQALDGRIANGMAAMGMAAHTGCNTVYGSTPPNNPHPYPWMNSLFQDGATVGWIMGETFIMDHSRRSVIPERLADALLDKAELTEADYFKLTHFTDTYMNSREIAELPKVWVVGGDGGMGDIGFQNVSKAVLQNRPNVNMLLLDTQVYSNTGGQNSDSSVMTGGFDMNQIGAASQGKLTEKKSVAEILTTGHGSPYVGQVSMANTANLYKAIIEGLEYRGVAFIQCYTSCQPEHGVPDFASTQQAQLSRDSRGMPEFIFDPSKGETFPESLSLKGNPSVKRDWYNKTIYKTTEKAIYTVAHWALTEARFRRHHKKANEADVKKLVPLEDMLLRLTQQDVVYRRHLDPDHRSYIPDWGVYLTSYDGTGTPSYHTLSRQMVLFCVERRKAWRLLQSKVGTVNEDYQAQSKLLKAFDAGDLDKKKFFSDIKVVMADLAEA